MGEDFHYKKNLSKVSSSDFYREMKNPAKSAFIYSVNRHITVLYKRYINLIEDLKMEHRIHLSKINKKIDDPEFLKNIEYFDDEKYNYIRKKILDLGNESIREIENFSTLINIEFKEIKEKEKGL